MLSLPLIVAPLNEGYVVIDGCKRLADSRRQGHQTDDRTVSCGILLPSPDAIGITLMRIRLNRYRIFSLQEKILYVKWLKVHCEPSTYAEACTLFTHNKNELSAIENLTGCNSTVIEAVVAGSVELPFAGDIDRLAVADRQALLVLFKQFAFSRQMQKELIDWLPELAFREKTAVSTILGSGWLQEILSHTKLNAPQKIDKLHQAVFEHRFPTIAKAKKTWIQQAASINPDPSNIILKPSEAFEKNRLEIKITITSAEQALSIFTKLHAIEPAVWEKLIYPAQLYGEF
jgi:hypothetical protein